MAYRHEFRYFGPHTVVTSLAPETRMTLGSHVVLCVTALGEPLTYKWFCADDVLNGCTHSAVDVSESAQPMVIVWILL